MADAIIVFNNGSTSLKFAAYGMDSYEDPPLICRGKIDEMTKAPHFLAKDATGKTIGEHDWGTNPIDHDKGMAFALDWLAGNLADTKIMAAGHRVVLGGERYAGPVKIDGQVLNYLEALTDVVPSHQSYNMQGIRAFAEAFPDLPQVACFDSSFHRTLPDVARVYALPSDILDEGIRRWGYHGLSYDYVSHELAKLAPKAKRAIIAHLGGGASLCAIRDGKSIDTTMGFGALSGVPMGTRSGDVPADALFYLLRKKLFDDASLEKTLYERSGLLGLSGVSDEMEVLQVSRDPQAILAIDYFVYNIAKYVGAYAAALEGLDAIVFTAGIGENSIPVRAAVCQRLRVYGIRLDEKANAAHGPCISLPESRVSVWVIPTDEEVMIARYALELLKK